MPKRHLRLLEDAYFNSLFQAAIQQAVAAIEGEDKDCRVLDLGAGAGLHAMMALRAGAHHVTATERWLYLALACKESLVSNGFTEEQYKVVYKRPTDLTRAADVPICCNLLLANIFDEGGWAAAPHLVLPAVPCRGVLNVLANSQPLGKQCWRVCGGLSSVRAHCHFCVFFLLCRPSHLGDHPCCQPCPDQPHDPRFHHAPSLSHRVPASCGATHRGGVWPGHERNQPLPLAPSVCGGRPAGAAEHRGAVRAC